MNLEKYLKSIVFSHKGILAGITNLQQLSPAPPSGDPRFLVPEAKSVISFAVALDEELIQGYLRKELWVQHGDDRKEAVQRLYAIGNALVGELNAGGFTALNVEVNNNYRKEEGAADITEMTEFHPEFSHRYAAVAAGLGRLGWSGNLVSRDFGALIELGSVITDAELKPDPPIPDEENPCDQCRICTAVCPVQMIDPRESVTIKIGKITERIGKKQPNTCCWIGCSGYGGVSAGGNWSNWSPYRLGTALPRDKAALDSLCTSLQKKDPQTKLEAGSLNNYRKAVFDPHWHYYTVCGFCRNVCAHDRRERRVRRADVQASGTAALAPDGSHVPAEKEILEVETPFGVNVVIRRSDEHIFRKGRMKAPVKARSPLDGAVLDFLYKGEFGGTK